MSKRATSVYEEKSRVGKDVASYSKMFADTQESNSPKREQMAKERMIDSESYTETFYNLVTDFYEYGWGQSFHFAPLYEGKDLQKCIAEYEQDVGRRVGAKPGMTIVVRGKILWSHNIACKLGVLITAAHRALRSLRL